MTEVEQDTQLPDETRRKAGLVKKNLGFFYEKGHSQLQWLSCLEGANRTAKTLWSEAQEWKKSREPARIEVEPEPNLAKEENPLILTIEEPFEVELDE